MFEELPPQVGLARRLWEGLRRLFTDPVYAASNLVLRRSPERMF